MQSLITAPTPVWGEWPHVIDELSSTKDTAMLRGLSMLSLRGSLQTEFASRPHALSRHSFGCTSSVVLPVCYADHNTRGSFPQTRHLVLFGSSCCIESCVQPVCSQQKEFCSPSTRCERHVFDTTSQFVHARDSCTARPYSRSPLETLTFPLHVLNFTALIKP